MRCVFSSDVIADISTVSSQRQHIYTWLLKPNPTFLPLSGTYLLIHQALTQYPPRRRYLSQGSFGGEARLVGRAAGRSDAI